MSACSPTRLLTALFAASLLLASPIFAAGTEGPKGPAPDLAAKIARFAPTVVKADTSRLSPGDAKALQKILEAAKLMDAIYLRQVWSGNVAMQARLGADESPAGIELLRYFRLNVGPWSRLDGNEPFVDGAPVKKPVGAGFYPEDMTKDEFEAWVKTLPEPEQKQATGFFHAVRRDAKGKLRLVPYSTEYKDLLEPAAKLLNEAAAATDNKTLAAYLKARATAFSTDDYYESDVAWMDLDAPLDITIGPYEVYEDELFNYKAAFEAFVTLRDDAETAKLGKFSGQLQFLEDSLPIDKKYRNPKIGASSPIRVVDEVFVAGDANHGVQTAAFNLPNDEKVIEEKGAKRVMLKNVQEAKFEKVMLPITKVVLAPEHQQLVSFDAFFTHILAHELVHGIGPHEITVDGKKTSARQQLKELHSALAEPQADLTGLSPLQPLADKGVLRKELTRTMYTTFLASCFRAVRFGIGEAHGKGIAMIFNFLTDEQAVLHDEKTGTFSVDSAKVFKAVEKLAGELMTIEAEGSYEKAKAILDRLGVVRPAMRQALDRLQAIPVDIAPEFPLAN